MTTAVLGTDSGVFWLRDDALRPLGLDDHRISAIFARERPDGATTILAGSYGDGLFRSEDGGEHWAAVTDGLTAPAFRTFAPDPANPDAILCGTEPGRIFRSEDDGSSWQELEGIRALEDVDEWYLPYSPRAGAVRNIYAPARHEPAAGVGGGRWPARESRRRRHMDAARRCSATPTSITSPATRTIPISSTRRWAGPR